MSRRIVFDARREGRRVVLRQRRPAVWRANGLFLAGLVGAGAAVGAWHVVCAAAGGSMRAAYVVVVFGLVAGSIRLARGGRR